MNWEYILGIGLPTVTAWVIKERKVIWSFFARIFTNQDEVIKHKDDLIKHLRMDKDDLESELEKERYKREKLQVKYEKQIIKSRGRK